MRIKFLHLHIKGHSIGVLAIFLLLALGFWLGDRLSGEYEAEVKISVTLREYNRNNMIFSTDVLQLDARVYGSGMVILKYYFHPPKLSISLDKVFPMKENSRRYSIPTAQLKELVEEALKEVQVRGITPDRVYLNTQKIIQKKLPVVPNVWITLKDQYLSTEVSLSPDSVWVNGPESIMDTLTRIRTKAFRAKASDRELSAYLSLDLHEGIITNEKKVRYYNKIQRYTQNQIRVPIQVLHAKPGTRVKLLPAYTDIVYRMPMDEIRNVHDSMFVLGVRYEDVLQSRSGFVKVHILKSPIPIRSMNLKDPYVEFIHFSTP